MTQRSILVTGADGFIGSHLTEALVRRGHRVRALALYNSFNNWGWLDRLEPQIMDGVEVVTGDVRDAHCVREAMRGCDTVFHLAALIAIPHSYRAPESYVDTNVTGTLNVLQAARELGVGKLVHTSTSEVYGTARTVPITEDHPIIGQSPYAATKIAADQLALSFQLSFGVPVAIIRPFNTYGPRQSARAVIPTIITQALAGRREICLGALHTTRDFSFVTDTVEGFIAIAESPRSIGEVINIGSGFEISIAEVVEVVAQATGQPLRAVVEDARLRPPRSEVERLLADTSKARALTGWEPAFGGRDGFRRGVEKTAAWIADPANAWAFKNHIYTL